MAVAHPAVNRGYEPAAVRRPAKIIEVMEFVVNVLLTLACGNVEHHHAFSGEILHSEPLELGGKIGDLSAIWTPARLAGIGGDQCPVFAVGTDCIDAAGFLRSNAPIDYETNPLAVGRCARVHVVGVRSVG